LYEIQAEVNMGKKEKNKKQPAGKPGGNRALVVAALVAVAIAVGAAIALTGGDKSSGPEGKAPVAQGQAAAKDESLRRGETRETLSPDLFQHPQIRAAYAAAKEIPWVLDSIYCYCYCEESPVFRHKSLLSCYVDQHAAA